MSACKMLWWMTEIVTSVIGKSNHCRGSTLFGTSKRISDQSIQITKCWIQHMQDTLRKLWMWILYLFDGKVMTYRKSYDI